MLINQAEDVSRPTLAILDWGIGGIDFYRIFKEKYPEVGVCYLSDSGDVPYGKQNKEELIERLCSIVEFLRQLGVSHLVVACNAMSTVLPAVLFRENTKDIQITGVIEPTITAVLARKGEKVGVVGGRRTILSGAYAKPLRERFSRVTQRIAQPLSALIEKGEKNTPHFHDTLEKIMSPLKKIDILVLACTHYPAVQEAFQALAPGAQLISPAAETLAWVTEHWRFNENSAPDIFYTTGNAVEMRSASFVAFGVSIGEITSLSKGFMK